MNSLAVSSYSLEIYGPEQTPESEAIVDLVLLAALERFKYQAMEIQAQGC